MRALEAECGGMWILRLLLLASLLLSLEEGGYVDPNGASTSGGGAMDPNGGTTAVGSGIDPDGAHICYTACIDPNG